MKYGSRIFLMWRWGIGNDLIKKKDVKSCHSNDETNEGIGTTNQMNETMQEVKYVMKEKKDVEVENNEKNRHSDSELKDDE